jgi:gas vesicle protein
MSDNNGGGILWFMAGLGIGAAISILYAPKSGGETRQRISAAAKQGRDVIEDGAQKVRDQAGAWADKGADFVSSQKDQIRSAVDAGRQAYQEAAAEDIKTAATNI